LVQNYRNRSFYCLHQSTNKIEASEGLDRRVGRIDAQRLLTFTNALGNLNFV